MPEPVYIEVGMHIMAPEPISTAFSINPSHQSVCLCVARLSLLSNSSPHAFPLRVHETKNWWTRRFLCSSCRIKGESVALCIPLSLLGNGSVKSLPRQRRIVDVVFYAVHSVLKENRWLVPPKTSVQQAGWSRVWFRWGHWIFQFT
jgi:hypothetical protein